jgi:hypothetical protein
VRQINGSFEFFFVRRVGKTELYVIYNLPAVGDEYEVGRYYDLPMPTLKE